MQTSNDENTEQDSLNDKKPSLENISSNTNICDTLFGNSTSQTKNDGNIEVEENKDEKEKSQKNDEAKEPDHIEDSSKSPIVQNIIPAENNAEIDKKEVESIESKNENVTNNSESGKIGNSNELIQKPLNKFIDSLESSTKNEMDNNTQTDRDTKIDDKNANSDIGKNSYKSNYSTSYSQSSSASMTPRSTQSKKKTNPNSTKSINNNQPPKLPGKLPQIVFHSPDSLTYKALSLQSLPPMNRETRSSVVVDLSSYIDQCTQEGMIAEANFIQEVSESVKKIPTPRKFEIQQLKLKDDLDNCEHEIEAQTSYWEEQEKEIKNDYQALIEELDDRLNNDLENLDREWQDPKKTLSYSKPSPTLLNYRYIANKLVVAKNFTTVPQLSKIISRRHNEEVQEATLRMKSDYKLAEANLITKYQKERETIDKMYQSKLDNLARMKERSLVPMQSRKKLMETKSAKLKTLQSKNPQSSTLPTTPFIANFDNTALNDLIAQPKLKLPPMKTAKRSVTSLSTTKKANTLGNKRKSDGKTLNKTSKSLNSRYLSPMGSTHGVLKSKSRQDMR